MISIIFHFGRDRGNVRGNATVFPRGTDPDSALQTLFIANQKWNVPFNYYKTAALPVSCTKSRTLSSQSLHSFETNLMER